MSNFNLRRNDIRFRRNGNNVFKLEIQLFKVDEGQPCECGKFFRPAHFFLQYYLFFFFNSGFFFFFAHRKMLAHFPE